MITISHTHADGTLITGSTKGDGAWEILRDLHAGWRPFRSLGCLGLPNSRDKLAKTWKIDGAATALRAAGYEVAVEIDESDRRDFAEAEAERYERAEDRAERMAGYADNATARSNELYTRYHGMADAIPFGQPMMPDHYSYGRDRRYRDRIESTARRSFAEADKAEHYAQRAENAETYRQNRESVPVTLRRIEKLEAEERQLQRRLDGTGLAMHGEDTPATGGYAERLTIRLADIAEELPYWRGIVAKQQDSGVKVWGPSDFGRGDYVLSGGDLYEVLRVSPKSVTVPDPLPLIGLTKVMSREAAQAVSDKRGFRRMYTRTIPYHEIRARKSADEVAAMLAETEQQSA